MWERVGEREREAPLAISQDSTTDTEVPPTPKNAPPSGGVFLGSMLQIFHVRSGIWVACVFPGQVAFPQGFGGDFSSA